MRSAPYLLIALFSSLQALITFYWMKAGATRSFTNVFQAMHGAVPNWTALAFSFGWYWLVLPLVGFVWLLLAWRRQEQRRHAWAVIVVSMLGFLLMTYAMYPLHIMLAKRVY